MKKRSKEWIYIIVYYLLHFILQTYYILRLIWKRFQTFFISVDPLLHIRRNISSFSKIPKHLAINIDESEYNLEELSNVIAWSIASEIKIITIYDFNGKLKLYWFIFNFSNNQKGKLKDDVYKLEKLVETSKLNLFASDINNAPYVIFCLSNKPIRSYEESTLNSKSNTIIHVTSLEDGRWHFVETIRKLAEIKVTQEQKKEKTMHDDNDKKSSAHHQHFTPKKLKDIYLDEFDPELMLVFGPMNTTAGFSPWHLRLTEIRFSFLNFSFVRNLFSEQNLIYLNIYLNSYLRTLKGIQCSIFVQALAKYSGTEQRFGK